jgi:hypothetical protein
MTHEGYCYEGGKVELVQRANTAMVEMMRGETAYLAHFARYIDQFAGAGHLCRIS